MDRRSFIKSSLVVSAASACSSLMDLSALASVAPKRVLVLGGTVFLGPAVVESLIAAGHTVTLFNRGVTNPTLFPNLEKLKGFRSSDAGDEDLSALSRRHFDVVVDVWPNDPAMAASAAEFLRERAGHYLYVSSIAAYDSKEFAKAGTVETAPMEPWNSSGRKYNRGKAESERRLHAILGERIPVSTANLPTATVPALALDFLGNPRPDRGNKNAFDVGAIEYATPAPAAPTLTSISPTSGSRGAVVPVTLTGTNFAAGATVAITGTGVTVSGVTFVSATSITATFTIATNATLGARSVTVTTGGGTTGAVTFTVTAALAPTLTAISPNSGPRGSSIITPTSEQVTLTGTNFITGATVAVSASGVTVSNVTVVNATTITATFSISSTATLGAHTVRVTTAGGPSNTVNFTVTAEVGGALTFTAATNGTLTGGGILTFTVPAARTPVTSVVTVKNTGAALTILEEEISMNAGLFTISNISCPVAPATLGNGATCTVGITYNTPATRPGLPNLGEAQVINNGTAPNGALLLIAQ